MAHRDTENIPDKVLINRLNNLYFVLLIILLGIIYRNIIFPVICSQYKFLMFFFWFVIAIPKTFFPFPPFISLTLYLCSVGQFVFDYVYIWIKAKVDATFKVMRQSEKSRYWQIINKCTFTGYKNRLQPFILWT